MKWILIGFFALPFFLVAKTLSADITVSGEKKRSSKHNSLMIVNNDKIDQNKIGSCGNGKVDEGEVCEQGDSIPCKSSAPTQFIGGEMTCQDCITWNPVECIPLPESSENLCGNKMLDDGELCEVGFEIQCSEKDPDKYALGMISCDECKVWNTSECVLKQETTCGNGELEVGEMCELKDTMSCMEANPKLYQSGDITCLNCKEWNLTSCKEREISICGNSILEEGETCELGLTLLCSEVSKKFVAGEVICQAGCEELDISGCIEDKTEKTKAGPPPGSAVPGAIPGAIPGAVAPVLPGAPIPSLSIPSLSGSGGKRSATMDSKAKEKQKQEAKKTKKEEKKPEQEKKKDDLKKKDAKKPPAAEKKAIIYPFANYGTIDILPPNGAVGAKVSVPAFIDETYYTTLKPFFGYGTESVKFYVEVPLNLELLNTHINEDNLNKALSFSVRSEDWDDATDFLKIIRDFSYKTEKKDISLFLGHNRSIVLGYGTLMRNFVPERTEFNHDILFDLNYKQELFEINSVVGSIAHMNVFAENFKFFPMKSSKDKLKKSLSFGFNFVLDHSYPDKLEREESFITVPFDKREDITDVGYVGAVENARIVEGEDGLPDVVTDKTLYAAGFYGAISPVQTGSGSLDVFIDYSWLQKFTNMGITTGVKYEQGLSIHKMIGELHLRFHKKGYAPAFFDTLYHVEKYEMVSNLFGEKDFSPNGVSLYESAIDSGDSMLVTYFMSGGYNLKDKLVISASIERNADSNTFQTNLQLIDLFIFSGYASYLVKGEEFSSLFNYSKNSSTFRTIGRLQFLPLTYLNLYLEKRWGFRSSEKYDPDGNYGHFDNRYIWGVGIEVSWDF